VLHSDPKRLDKSSEYNLMKYACVFVMSLHWTACGWGIFPQLDSTAADTYISRRRLGGDTAAYVGDGPAAMDDDAMKYELYGFDSRNWIDRMAQKMGHVLTAGDKYALSIDFALSCMCMGYGTVDAKTITEVWFSIGCMMVAGAVYAYVIGGICEALTNEDPASKQFREATDMLNGFFRKHPHIQVDLRQQCNNYMEVYRSKIQESVYNKVLNLFTPYLQQKLAVGLMASLLQVLCTIHCTRYTLYSLYIHWTRNLLIAPAVRSAVY
jgi:hypothetical protein